jgi:hypothetical protein
MKKVKECRPGLAGACLIVFLFARIAFSEEVSVHPDSTLHVGGRTATVVKLESLPLVENEYSKRFKFDSATNPKLKELRERYRLEGVVAAGKDEFERQVILMDWAHNQFRKFGQPSRSTKGALEILEGIAQGGTFFCTQYAQLMASAATSMGWVDRVLALRRHQGVNAKGGSTEHSTTEIWSNQHRKWVMLDPTSNMYLEKSGVPLNAWEIRQEWFYNGGKELTFVIGKERQRYKKGDLPIFLRKFDGFGDLTVEPDELDKYGFIGYIPNTDLMDSGFDYGGMFIVKDALCDGTQWHKRDLPKDPAHEPYFPLGQAAVSVRPKNDKLVVLLKTLTPNFKTFEVKESDDNNAGEWRRTGGNEIEWKLQPGLNRFEARTVNAFGVTGPVSVVEVRAE